MHVHAWSHQEWQYRLELQKLCHHPGWLGGCPRGVMVEAMVCKIVAREFKLQLRYYVHFQTNTLGKGMNTRYPPSYGLNSTTTVLLLENGFGIK